jgi:hypothetical protein
MMARAFPTTGSARRVGLSGGPKDRIMRFRRPGRWIYLRQNTIQSQLTRVGRGSIHGMPESRVPQHGDPFRIATRASADR